VTADAVQRFDISGFEQELLRSRRGGSDAAILKASLVVKMVMRASMLIVAIGIVIGLAAAIGAGRLVATLLFGLAPTDGLTIGIAILVMIAVSTLAGYLPARGASRVDPLTALRYEYARTLPGFPLTFQVLKIALITKCAVPFLPCDLDKNTGGLKDADRLDRSRLGGLQ